MAKRISNILVAISFVAILLTGVFANISVSAESFQLSFSQTAEASSKSWRKWARDVGRDIRRDFRNDVRREIRRDIRRWEREQRNIIRADGDARFANRYLSDREVRALRILKRCPVGVESNLFLMNNDASAVRSMCRILPEFSYVGPLKDQYKENLGIVVFRHY